MSVQPDVPRFPLPPPDVPYDPAPGMRKIMEKCPVSQIRLPDDSPAWLVTGFSEAREVFTDQRYSRALIFAPGRKQFGVDVAAADSILSLDPPEHSRLRKLVAGAFTGRRIQALRPRIAQLVDELIDGMLAGPHPTDLVQMFSLPLPSQVICLLLGVPFEDTGKFHAWSNTIFGDWSRSPEAIERAYAEIGAYLAELIARKRETPQDDLVSVLIDARDAGGRLSEGELVNFCFALLAAGHETTANMINLSFAALCQNPEQLDRLRADPGLLPGAVEELLRYVTLATIGMPRITREEVRLGGITIPEGETVIPSFNVANRDPAAFEEPDRLDVGREPRPHLAFGAGVHHCVGAQLARIELQEAFRGLLTRLPGLRMAVPMSDLEFHAGQAITSMRELPVTWDDV